MTSVSSKTSPSLPVTNDDVANQTELVPLEGLPSIVLVDLKEAIFAFIGATTRARDMVRQDILLQETVSFLNKPLTHNRNLDYTVRHVIDSYALLTWHRGSINDQEYNNILTDLGLHMAVRQFVCAVYEILKSKQLYYNGRLPYRFREIKGTVVVLKRRKNHAY